MSGDVALDLVVRDSVTPVKGRSPRHRSGRHRQNRTALKSASMTTSDGGPGAQASSAGIVPMSAFGGKADIGEA